MGLQQLGGYGIVFTRTLPFPLAHIYASVCTLKNMTGMVWEPDYRVEADTKCGMRYNTSFTFCKSAE